MQFTLLGLSETFYVTCQTDIPKCICSAWHWWHSFLIAMDFLILAGSVWVMWTGRIWSPYHVQSTMWCMQNLHLKKLSNISCISGFIAILVLKGHFCCLNICQQLAGEDNLINTKILWVYDWIYNFISYHQEFCYKQGQTPFPIISSPSLRKRALPLVCCNSPMPCQICKAIINPL